MRTRSSSRKVTQGIIYFLSATFMFSIFDGIGKYLGDNLPAIEVVYLRFLFVLCFCAIYVICKNRKKAGFGVYFHNGELGTQLLRGVTWTLCAIFFYFAFLRGSLTIVYIITFIHPIVSVFMARIRGKDWPPSRSILLIVLMLLGVVTAIVYERGGEFSAPQAPVVIFSLLAAVFFATELSLTAQLKEEFQSSDENIQLVSSLVGVLTVQSFGLVYLIYQGSLYEGDLSHVIKTPSATEWALLISQSLFSFVGNLLLIRAFNSADESVLAPFDYSILIFGMVIDVLFFNKTISLGTVLGGSILLLSGIAYARTIYKN